MIKKILFFLLLLKSNMILAYDVTISQIDPSNLFLNQEVKLYINVSDDSGNPIKNLKEENFRIYEYSPINKKFFKINKIESFKSNVNKLEGINFFLMIDNSGSMYRDMNGKKTGKVHDTRIVIAKNAVVSFLKGIKNSIDKVGIGTYNTYFKSYISGTTEKSEVERLLNNIEKPGDDEVYTEIYASLILAIKEFKQIKGRKVVIILSDGINQPYYRTTGKLHKVYGNKIYKYSEPIKECIQEGITVFSIYLGPRGGKKDKYLEKISKSTGGFVFSARNQDELKNIYAKISNHITNEYMMTYKASMEPADKKTVMVQLKRENIVKSAKRFYFSSLIFGMPLSKYKVIYLIPLLIALFFLYILYKIKFENKSKGASLNILDQGSTKVSTDFLMLGRNRTIISSDINSDLTIVNDKTKAIDNNATIVFDEKKKSYTLVGEGELRINNKPVKTKILEPGDVISINGATVVFDDNE